MTLTTTVGVQSDPAAYQQRLARARNEDVTVQLTDSGNAHMVIMTDGRPQECSCPDCRMSGNVCKHMIAIDRCEMDQIVFSNGDTVDVSA
jgi:hypothetical protein